MTTVQQPALVDVRTRLVQEKPYRVALPQALEDWLWAQKPSASAERVFRVHWGEGYRQQCRGGTYVTQLSEEYVARLVGASVPTVQRAYRELKDLKLIRRIVPDRGQDRFKRPVTQTEVVIPRDILSFMLSSPDRRKPSPVPPVKAAQEPVAPKAPAGVDATLKTAWEKAKVELAASLPAPAFATYIQPLHAAVVSGVIWLYAPNHFVLDWVQRHHGKALQAAMEEAAGRVVDLRFSIGAAGSAPFPVASPGVSRPTPAKPVLSIMVARRVAERISEVAPGADVSRLLHEVLWSVAHGSFSREPVVAKAFNACVKLIKEGRWRRPKRMPTGWAFELAVVGEGPSRD